MIYQKRVTIVVALLVVLMFIATACNGSTASLESTVEAVAGEVEQAVEEAAQGAAEEEVEEGAEGEEAGEQAHEEHWIYAGEGGPEHWGGTCATGRAQSPIDISRAEPAGLTNILFHYESAPVTISNNGHTVQVSYPNITNNITLAITDTIVYNLEQFHFHAPSEHTINDEPADVELHLVHRNAAGKLAVVAVLINSGTTENAAFAPVWEQLPDSITPTRAPGDPTPTPSLNVNPADLIPAGSTFYTYPGSLTTPPCTEGVRWLVLTTPIEMSAGQIEAFAEIFDFRPTNRPLQQLNDRELLEDNTTE